MEEDMTLTEILDILGLDVFHMLPDYKKWQTDGMKSEWRLEKEICCKVCEEIIPPEVEGLGIHPLPEGGESLYPECEFNLCPDCAQATLAALIRRLGWQLHQVQQGAKLKEHYVPLLIRTDRTGQQMDASITGGGGMSVDSPLSLGA